MNTKQEFYLSGAESNMDDAMMNMLLGSGAESMEDAMMRMFLGMSSSYSGITSRLCNEDDWEDHPMGELFRAAKDHQIFEVESLLEQDKYREGVNELDGDGAGVLHNVALDSKLSEEDAEAIVQAFKNAGADLDLRGGNMMSSETPLHVAACYGRVAMVKALINAGATADICDNYGRTPLYRAKDLKSSDGQKSLQLIRSAVTKERSDPNYVDAVTRKANEFRQLAEDYWDEEEMGLAMEKYQQILRFPHCDKDYRNHANLAGCALQDAIIKKTSGRIGGRNSFKIAYEAASKAVEIEPEFEIGWEEMARAYMGYRELPRAKQACANGLKHFPKSEILSEIWSVLDQIGVPDLVVDHESQEFMDIYERIYMDRWIGSVGCDYCALSCMDEPRPEKCPFCGCPDKEIDDDANNMIIRLIVYGKNHEDISTGEDDEDSSIGEDDEDNSIGQDDEDCSIGQDDESDSDDLDMPPLIAPSPSNKKAFTFAAPSQNGSTSFDFGSPSNGTETKFVFGSPETKGGSK